LEIPETMIYRSVWNVVLSCRIDKAGSGAVQISFPDQDKRIIYFCLNLVGITPRVLDHRSRKPGLFPVGKQSVPLQIMLRMLDESDDPEISVDIENVKSVWQSFLLISM